MTPPTNMRILSVILVLLFINLTVVPFATAESFSAVSHDTNVETNDSVIAANAKDQMEKDADSTANRIEGNNVGDMDIVVGVWAISVLGMTAIVALLQNSHGNYSAAWVKDNVYERITDSGIVKQIVDILKGLGVLSPENYTDAYSRGAKWGNEADVYDKPDPCKQGQPEKSVDYRAKSNGNLVTRIYYNAKGWREITWDYDGHMHGGFPKIHAHRWFLQFDKQGNCIPTGLDKRRPVVTFNNDGTETLEYEVPEGVGKTRSTL